MYHLYRLIASVDHAAALALIESQCVGFLVLANESGSRPAGQAGIKHLDYFIAHWMSMPTWRSWSEWGRLAASTAMNVSINGVVPTTNHLESFNAILKRKHLPSWLHSGHRLRFDSLIHILITRILPGIFNYRRAQQEYSTWLANRFRDHAGGANLAEIHQRLVDERRGIRKTSAELSLSWWVPDKARDEQAKVIVHLRRIVVSRGPDTESYVAVCASSKANILNADHVCYQVMLHRSGLSTCTCPDFMQNRGACKHLRATRSIVDNWILSSFEAAFIYPTTYANAHQLHEYWNPPQILDTTNPTLPSLPPTTDWTLLQVLGNDNTTVDDREDEQVIEVDEDCDEESDKSDCDIDSMITGVAESLVSECK